MRQGITVIAILVILAQLKYSIQKGSKTQLLKLKTKKLKTKKLMCNVRQHILAFYLQIEDTTLRITIICMCADFQTVAGSDISTRNVLSHKMGLQGWAAAHKPKISLNMPCVSRRGMKHATTGLWSSGNVMSGIMTSHCKILWRINISMGLFFKVWTKPLFPVTVTNVR